VLPPEPASEPVVVGPASSESVEPSSAPALAVVVLVVSDAVGPVEPDESEVEPEPPDWTPGVEVDPGLPQSDSAAAETAWPWPGPLGAERATLETNCPWFSVPDGQVEVVLPGA